MFSVYPKFPHIHQPKWGKSGGGFSGVFQGALMTKHADHGKTKRVLRLNLKCEYWEAIRDGVKPEEFRLVTPYWEKRLSGSYDEIHLLWGYPRAGDESRILRRAWAGYRLTTITHKHFGDAHVSVFAIDVTRAVKP